MITKLLEAPRLSSRLSGRGSKYLSYTLQDAREYDWKVAALVPGYGEMLRAIVDYARAFKNGTQILDLGGGTGTLAKMLLESRPDFRVRVVDFSQAMCHMASEKLSPFSHNVLVDCCDMQNADLGDSRVLISTLALHECSPDVRRTLLSRILKQLSAGDVLIVGDYYRPRTNRQSQLVNEIRQHAYSFDIDVSEVDEEIREHLFDDETPSLEADFDFVNSMLNISPLVAATFSAVTLWCLKR